MPATEKPTAEVSTVVEPTAETPAAEALDRALARVAKAVITAYALGDTPTVLALAHPDAAFRFPGDPAVLPWAGSYRGDEMARFHDRVKDHLDMLAFTAERYEVHGDTVLVFMRETCRVKLTGRVFENEMVGLMTIEAGRVRRYLEYSDTARMEAAFGP